LIAWLVAGPCAAEREAGMSPAEGIARIAASSNAFGLDLYGHLRSSPGNVALSPASISVALAMTWLGAKGETAACMKRVLRVDGSPGEVAEGWGKLSASLRDSEDALTFRVANRLFGEKSYTFVDAFQDATRAAFGAPLEAVDLKSAPEPTRAHINGWVEGETQGRIRNLIPEGVISPDARLILVNAVYFLARWRDPFAKEATSAAPFFTSKSRQKDVPTMRQMATLRLAHRQGVKVLEIPYMGDRMSLLVALPDERDGLDAVEASLRPARLEAWVKALAPERVAVSLPKFEVNPSGAVPLGELLKAMGMGIAFDRQKADFTGIANPPDPSDRLSIGAVLHKAFVKVDEMGTEAAAATTVMMLGATAMRARPVEFKADHPFLFFLRDDVSGLILFMGRVAEP
jgi:serpin B